MNRSTEEPCSRSKTSFLAWVNALYSDWATHGYRS